MFHAAAPPALSDLLSAGVAYVGAHLLPLSVPAFAVANLALTPVWLLIASRILMPARIVPRIAIHRLAPAAMAMGMLGLAAPADAQQTRQEQLEAQRAEKAAQLQPYEADGLEKRLQTLDRFMATPNRRLYPFVGSVFPGGGLAIGPGYRSGQTARGRLDAHAAWSIRNYKTADATWTLPNFGSKRLTLAARGQWLDARNVAFYGAGNDSSSDQRSGIDYRTATIGLSARVRASRAGAAGGGFDSIHMTMESRQQDGLRIAQRPTYGRTYVFAEVDSRSSPGYTRDGGLYRVELSDYRQMNGSSSSFRRVDAEVQRFIPVLRENWVIALRALASSTQTSAGQDVPYLLMPDLGGSHTLRGYPAWRFRDRNRLLFTGEYRWSAGQLVDMALFLDAGKVAPRARDLNLRNLTKTYGVGVSIHTPSTTIVRLEFARTPDGNSVALSFSPSF